MYENIYEPAEDSFFMERTLKNYLTNKSNMKITEVGVGSGFVFSEILNFFPNNSFSGTDINSDAIKSTKKRLFKSKFSANLFQGNLLEPIVEKQDLIFFNTPYLPCESGEKYDSISLKDKAIYGGKNGYEVIFNFIDQIGEKLTTSGKVFMLFSSLSKEKQIKEKLEREGFFIEEIYREKHFMEELIIYEFSKSNIVQNLEKLNISNISYMTKGKHSVIYSGICKSKNVVCKTSENNFIEKEIIFLEKLKKYNFVPKLYSHKKGIIVMEKCLGQIIRDFLEKSSKNGAISVLQKCLDICYALDSLGYQKFELTNPYKHIFIDDNLNVKFIDFERTIHSESPKNTTQFLQYIRRNIPILRNKNISISEKNILRVGEKYKSNKNKINIIEILN